MTTTEKNLRDAIARYVYEAKQHRLQAGRMRQERARLKELPMSQRDPMRVLTLSCSINERVRLAQQCSKEAAKIRLQINPKSERVERAADELPERDFYEGDSPDY